MFKIWKSSPSPERRGVKSGGKLSSARLDFHPTDLVKVDVVSDGQPNNPFTEIQVLNKHTDILRLLIKVDKHRCASVGDDAKIMVWDVQVGRNIAVLDYHTRPVTCLCVWDNHGLSSVHGPILISAASDKQICMWDIDGVKMIRTITGHNSTARCVIPCPNDSDVFYSAGENLCLWDINGRLLCKYDRDNEEDITDMVSIVKDKVIAVVDKRLYVYAKFRSQTDDQNFKIRLIKKLPSHRESIGSIIRINDELFASGSLDGTIILWSAQQLVITKSFNTVKNYEGDDKLYPLSVQHMANFGKKYLVASIGSGFRIYDIDSGALLAEKINAHYSKVLHAEFVYHGYILATCSEDGAIRLWGTRKSFQPADETTSDSLNTIPESDIFQRFSCHKKENDTEDKHKVFVPELLGECIAHSGAVQACVNVDGDTMVSGGKDGLVILWRNGIQESLKRDECLKDMLYGTANGFV